MADLKKGLLENVSEVEENMVLTENLETQEGCERWWYVVIMCLQCTGPQISQI